MEVNKKYAAFIITYKRVAILKDTIEKIFQQTLPPQKVLIVDNDPEKSAEVLLSDFTDKNIGYFSVGHNAGPAGAGFHGLKLLFAEGWEWVLWMDDNDPPHFPDVLEHLFQIPEKYPHPEMTGMLGAVGVKFNSRDARINRVPDNELTGIIEVDNVAGNMMPVIHKRVYERNVFPDPDLFFGYEELDFSLSIIRNGFKVLISGEELYRHREKAGRLNLKKKVYNQKKIQSLWREYYSIRNLTYILLKKEKSYAGVVKLFFRAIGKAFFGYKYGFAYGFKNMKLMIAGFCAGIFGKLGYRAWVIK